MPAKSTKKNMKRTKELKQTKKIRAEKPPEIDSFMTFHNFSGGGNWLHAEWLEGRTQRYAVG